MTNTQTRNEITHAPATEVRGFALYVGLPNNEVPDTLGSLVGQLKQRIAELAPHADTYAAVALAPTGVSGDSLEIVRRALGEPATKQRHRELPQAIEDRATSGVTIDLSRGRVLLDNVFVPFTFREFAILRYLVLREGRTISRDELIERLWSEANTADTPSERTIDVYVRRLRTKLGSYQDIVRTVRGRGYRFDRHADVSIVHRSAPSPDIF